MINFKNGTILTIYEGLILILIAIYPARCYNQRMRNFDRGGHRDNRNRSFNREGQNRNYNDDRRHERQMFSAICANCGKSCQVPFKPSPDKPVYCDDCFAKIRGVSKQRENKVQDQRPTVVSSDFSGQLNSLNSKLDKVLSLLTAKSVAVTTKEDHKESSNSVPSVEPKKEVIFEAPKDEVKKEMKEEKVKLEPKKTKATKTTKPKKSTPKKIK